MNFSFFHPHASLFLPGLPVGKWGNKVHTIIQKPAIDEVNFYLRQAIDICYRSRGHSLPMELKAWIKRGVKINFEKLPRDIQDGVKGILLQSHGSKKVVTKIIINLPK